MAKTLKLSDFMLVTPEPVWIAFSRIRDIWGCEGRRRLTPVTYVLRRVIVFVKDILRIVFLFLVSTPKD